MGKTLKISLQTGRIDVPDVPAADASDSEKSERTLQVVGEVTAELDEVEGLVSSEPREALKRLWVLERHLDAYPVRWIRNYARRQEHNEAAKRVKSLRERAAGALGEDVAEQAWQDLDYLREALPLLFEKLKVGGEILRLILTPLGKLEHSRIRYQRDDVDDLARLCRDVGEEIRRTADLDDEVRAWGEENYPAILTEGARPARIPAHVVGSSGGGSALVAVGLLLLAGAGAALAGVVPGVGSGLGVGGGVAAAGLITSGLGVARIVRVSGERRAAPRRFAELASRFRERLYLICTLRVLDQMTSRYTRASEGFAAYLREHGGPQRWKRVKLQDKDLTQLFVGDADSWHEKETIETWLTEQVKQTYRLDSSTLISPEELTAQDWEVILRAYLLESFDDDRGKTEAPLLDTVSDILFARRGEDVSAERERVFKEVYAAWDRMAGRRGAA